MPETTSLMQHRIGRTQDPDVFKSAVLQDYRICCVSREVSLLGRKEVLTGKAKFGILGDGKEVPQVALARTFRKGDWRSGYYRDQTMMMALGLASVEDYFAQLYADPDNDPWSGGRQMNAHFATPSVDATGEWTDHMAQFNTSSDISPTAGQMARAVGLALASRYYRRIEGIPGSERFSNHGNEVCFCNIGDASTSEGVFWEALNAAAVMKIPLAVSVWDDGYGISVPTSLQTIKASISKALEGFLIDERGEGIHIYTAKAWDYPGLCAMYERGIERVRQTHIPALFHIQECTQPQGHSTSGSHERYKSEERLKWESDADCIRVMRRWMIENAIASEEEVQAIEEEAVRYVKERKQLAWRRFYQPVENINRELEAFYHTLMEATDEHEVIDNLHSEFASLIQPVYSEIVANARKLHYAVIQLAPQYAEQLRTWIDDEQARRNERYRSHLYSEHASSALKVPVVEPEYEEDAKYVNGYQVLNAFFDKVIGRDERILAFGEDVGRIGDVNQGFAGIQDKYGEERVFDTGIREWTIIGQAIGTAMRGLRPIGEIQYLDYLVYGLTPLTDDLATLRYRSNGQQQAPAIIRTRGHRLEGIWHSGSQLGMLIHALRGMYLCVPRNMVQAAGMYNTLLQGDDPALVIECLNSYRRKERLPVNIGDYTVPLGLPEILREGTDITLVTYGSVIHEVDIAVDLLADVDISVEIIDVQTLLPFDLEHVILESVRKTNRVIFVDEDVPGGASAYMMQQVLDQQGAYRHLDAKPQCLSGTAHRPPYGSDGDYFSKPNAGTIYERIYNIMHEADPESYPSQFTEYH